ncbi:MAG: nucleoside deaminase [Clostridia bacterium]|nr:nucleoside deaminase [Clostridia bacterium]
MNEEGFMAEALEEARRAMSEGEIPVGCVIVRGGRIVARAHNRREQDRDPTAHAEILAIREAARALGRWRLEDCELYVTLEPCPMCAGAVSQARLKRLVYGAPDPRQGCAGSIYRITEDPAFPHFCPADPGPLGEACGELLRMFFEGIRSE